MGFKKNYHKKSREKNRVRINTVVLIQINISRNEDFLWGPCISLLTEYVGGT